MSKLDLIYFAGFFDGEGYIGICPQRHKNIKGETYSNYRLNCTVGSTNHWIVESMKFQFGGIVHTGKRLKPNHKQYWVWMSYSKQALDFLREIYPYLRLKKAEANIAIKWGEKWKKGQKTTSKSRALDEAQNILLKKLKQAG